MTRPVRTAGVVVVAALVVAVPALASGRDRTALHATSVPALLCVGPVTPASSGVVLAPVPQTQAGPAHRSLGPARAHRRRKHSKGQPPFGCIPPCAWIVTEPIGATGVTGRPAACQAHPVCVRTPAGQTRLCPPCGVESTDDPDDATDPAGTTLACLPVWCRIPLPQDASGATGATACPLPPTCPLIGTARASICPGACAVPGTGATRGATGTKAICPPIPPCPPSPRPARRTPRSTRARR